MNFRRIFSMISNILYILINLLQLLCITALPITPVLAFVKRWLFGSLLCKLIPLCQGISGNFLIAFLVIFHFNNFSI